MNSKTKTVITVCFQTVFSLSFMLLHGQNSAPGGKMQRLINENFAFADSQYRYMMTLTTADKMPQSYVEKDNKFVAHDITWWCSGFYAGTLWYIYEQTKNEAIRKEAERCLTVLEPNQDFTGNHDLGFMMYCSFGNGYRINQNARYKDILFRSALSLATRYRPSIQSIQSWDKSKLFECPVIIDNMMNLELLYWVSDNGGDKRFRDIAIAHANSTINNHYRPDYSSYHVIDYDLSKNIVKRKITWQGAANCSPWARGQAWGLYGFVTMHRFSKNKTYLNQAKHIANFILSHPNLPEDKIPYWDFEAPFIPNAKRDASAGAIIASALLELGQYTSGAERKKYVDAAAIMIESLSGNAYRARSGENGGFILKHSTGALPQNSEIDVPLIYADYYFLEALKRYKDWYL